MPANVETMFSGSSIVPWHKLGTVVEGTLSSAEAIAAAGLDWHVSKVPMYARITTNEGHGLWKHDPNTFAIVRDSDHKVLGAVGTKYQPIQNHDGFEVLDSLGSNIQYETAGSIDGGSTVWILAKTPQDLKIAGDDVRPYFLATMNHDGTGRMRVRPAHTRVVCANTLRAALNENAGREFTCSHTAYASERLKQAAKLLGVMHDQNLVFESRAAELLANSFSTQDWENLCKQLLPKPEGDDVTDRQLRSYEQRFHDLRGSLNVPDLANIRGTAWGALNAVADYEQHAKRVKGDESKQLETLFKRSFMDSNTLTNRASELLFA